MQSFSTHVRKNPALYVTVSNVYVIHDGVTNPTKYRKHPIYVINNAANLVRVVNKLDVLQAMVGYAFYETDIF